VDREGSSGGAVTLPNLLSGTRLAFVPLLLILAWHGQRTAYLSCLAISLLTDVLDGLLARLLKQKTALGARLDSVADFATTLSLPPCAWWLWPEVVRREFPYVAVALAFYLGAVLAGLLKFRRLTSYHSWLGKFAALVLGPSIFVLFLLDAAWPFRAAALIAVASAFEEVLITWILPSCQANVATLVHALRLRQEPRIRPPKPRNGNAG
jgi:phosphatidylglycerophosphate synthase